MKDKPYCLVWAHGWGMTPDYWLKLLPFFQEEVVFVCDFGYFGTPSWPSVRELAAYQCIGVGHSLGFLKLLSWDVPWVHLCGLQSFLNFLGKGTSLFETRYREWSRLTRSLMIAPEKTLMSFYARAGVRLTPNWDTLCCAALQEDLEALGTLQSCPEVTKMTLIATEDDPIVPYALWLDNFKTRQGIDRKVFKTGGHHLGQSHVRDVAQTIQRVMRSYVI